MTYNTNSKKYNHSSLNTKINNRPVPHDNIYLSSANHLLQTRHILPSQINSISLNEQTPRSYYSIQSTTDVLSSHSNEIHNIVPFENRSVYGTTTLGHGYLPKINNQEQEIPKKHNKKGQFGNFNTDTRKSITQIYV